MSNFTCEQCGMMCIDTSTGYITGCEHYPADGAGKKFNKADTRAEIRNIKTKTADK